MGFRNACALVLAFALSGASFSACRSPVAPGAPDDDDDPVLSSDATLSGLVVRLPRSTANLLPSFKPGTYAYTLSPVVNETSAIVIEATARDAGARVAVPDAPLCVGNNTFAVVVTAADGATRKTYSIQIRRYADESEGLASLGIAELPEWSPDPRVPAHSVNVPALTERVTIQAEAEFPGSTMETRLDPALAFMPFDGSEQVELVGGETRTVTIRVTSEFSRKYSDYTLSVTRAPESASDDASLSGLSVTGSNGAAVQLSPAFARGTRAYSAEVASTVSSLAVTPTTLDPAATFSVSGADSIEIGQDNTVTIAVTAEDGVTPGTYTITVTRRSYPTIAITAPGDGASIEAGAFTVSGTYDDPAGEISRIVAMFGGAAYAGTMRDGTFSVDVDASGATNGSKSLIVLGYPGTGSVPAAVATTNVTIVSGATGYNVSCAVVLPDNARSLPAGYMTMCLVSGESLVDVDWDINVSGIEFPYRYTFTGIPDGSYSIIIEVVDDQFVNALYVGESAVLSVAGAARDFGSVYLTEYIPEE